MSPRLVICLILSALAGLGAAAGTILSGFGLLLALVAYSGTGSVTLFALAIAVMPRPATASRPAMLAAPAHQPLA